MGFQQLDLTQMRQVDIRTIDRSTLKDIGEITIDTTLPQEEKIASFIEQIGNPYCYKCGDMVIKITFAENETATIEDRLEHYLSTL